MGFKIGYVDLTVYVYRTKIYRDWVVYGKYKSTICDVGVYIYEYDKKYVIKNKTVAKNPHNYLYRDIKLKQLKITWYGLEHRGGIFIDD